MTPLISCGEGGEGGEGVGWECCQHRLETVKRRILERQIKEDRADDNEEIAIKRFKTYEKSAEPVVGYYKQSNLLKTVNGEAGISEINSEISDLIDTIKGWL